MGPIYPGGASTVTVSFTALEPISNQVATVTNYCWVTNATFMNAVPANTGTSQVPVVINPCGTIGDFVWRDLNGDGVQDGGNEKGIFGVSVVLTPPTNIDAGAGAGVAITNVTDGGGYYYFYGLPTVGIYTVRVVTTTLPGGTGTNTFDEDGVRDNRTAVYINPVTNGTNNTHITTDFGYQVGAMLEGTVWEDVNRSATTNRDPGEPWITNLTVYLCRSPSPCGPGVSLATNRTDTNGYFRFTSPSYTGNLTVLIYTNTGAFTNGYWAQTFDTDGLGSSNYVSVTVVSGGTARADFSYVRPGAYALGDTLFYDWNSNGTQEVSYEEGIPNITVSLYRDVNSNGVVDAGIDPIVGTTSTTVNGYYSFTNLSSRNYLVVVDQGDVDFPPRYFCTADPWGLKDGLSFAAITTSNRWDQDFGYWPYDDAAVGDFVWADWNGNGIQNGGNETGLSAITVSLYVDFNNDGTWFELRTTETTTNGYYLFDNLPAGTYRVGVSTNDTDLPKDAFGERWSPSTTNLYTVALTNWQRYLDADFGFVPLGAIGDTVFWDRNSSGSQDWNEDGITGVTVRLYYDVDGNRVYNAGTDVLAGTRVTSTNGKYLFSGLWPTNYIVVVDTTSPPITNSTLMADPDNDGLPCTAAGVTNCDSAYGYAIDYGEIFLGADFGYLPPGVIGDLVWVDQNNGVRDAGEKGIPYVSVLLYSNGTAVATNETDPDGWYAFGNLGDGTFRVVVDTNDVDFPANLYAVYDYDGPPYSWTTNIVISNGVVTSIGGIACTECNLDVDFGYRYPGTNSLSGTVGLDALPFDGLMGTTGSGYSTNEAPFPNVIVYLKLWNDDGDSVVEDGEWIDVFSTSTDTNGDYSFTKLPTGSVSSFYIVSLAAPAPNLRMTTTNGSTTAITVVNATNAAGDTRSAYQVLTIQPVTTNIDFAFTWTLAYDFGDLPQSYSTVLQNLPSGPQNQILRSTNLYLGAGVDTEVNGQPTADATGDGADEDGVGVSGNVVWQNGSSGRVNVVVGKGGGWLAGYIDFNKDGTFMQPGEMVADQAVTVGTYSITFAIPTNAIYATTSTVLYVRFRLFPSRPFIPALSFAGTVNNGEVEDYRWLFGALGDTVWEDGNSNGTRQIWEPLITGAVVYVDLNTNALRDAGEPYVTIGTNAWATNGISDFYWIGGFPSGSFIVRVDTNTLRPDDLFATYDLDGGTDSVTVVTMSVGEVITNVDFGYRTPRSTYALISRFDGSVVDGQVVLEWETAAEFGTVGFNLYRLEKGSSEAVPVNDRLLPACLESQGGSYRWVDASAAPGRTYFYQLNEVQFDRKINVHGLFEVALPEVSGSPAKALRKDRASAQPFVRAPRVSEFAQSRRAASRKVAPSKLADGAGGVPGTWEPLKAFVTGSGAHFVSASAIAGLLGVPEAEVLDRISNGNVEIRNRGLVCNYLPAANGLYFYGEAPNSIYTVSNVYWLNWNSGKIMAKAPGVEPAPQEGGTFADTLHIERDLIQVTAWVADPESDYWYWNYVIGGDPPLDKQNYVLPVPGVASCGTPASLVVHLQGGTATGTKLEHHVQVSLNGTPVGETAWDGIQARSFTNTFSQSLLLDGSNSVTVTALLDTGTPYSVVYVDSFDLTYSRRYEAVENQLLARGDGHAVVSVAGFSSPRVVVLNVSDPRKPVVQKAVAVDAFGGGFRASFVPSGPQVPYQLFARGTGEPPASLAVDSASSLRLPGNEAEYVVITVPLLAAAAQDLANYRSSKGLKSKVVLIADIYDDFNYGLAEAPAIRQFLSFAAQYWAVPPHYVVLAGEGTYDYRDCRGMGGNLVPAMMAATPQGIFASDSWYGDLDDDGVPELAVGRLPAMTGSEMSFLVNRIVGYESGEGGKWKQDVLLAADNPDDGGDFPGSSEGVGSFVPPDYGIDKVYLSEVGPAEARSLMSRKINQGAAFVNFFGHGGLDRMASERMLTSADAGALTNGSRLPVVVSLSCAIGQFALPGFDCLSEVLLLSPGGAVAAWSPSGESFNKGAQVLADKFYRVVFREGEGVLGDAVVKAMRQFDDPRRAYTLKIYNLLGDPAMHIEGVAFVKPSTTLEGWRSEEFSDAQLGDVGYSGFDADPDGDGVLNLMEYAMGWNPQVADGDSGLVIEGPWEVLLSEGGEAAVRYQRRKDARDVEFQLQSSQDLVAWSAADPFVQETVVTDDENGLTESVQTTLLIPPFVGKEHVFVRLLIQQP